MVYLEETLDMIEGWILVFVDRRTIRWAHGSGTGDVLWSGF